MPHAPTSLALMASLAEVAGALFVAVVLLSFHRTYPRSYLPPLAWSWLAAAAWSASTVAASPLFRPAPLERTAVDNLGLACAYAQCALLFSGAVALRRNVGLARRTGAWLLGGAVLVALASYLLSSGADRATRVLLNSAIPSAALAVAFGANAVAAWRGGTASLAGRKLMAGAFALCAGQKLHAIGISLTLLLSGRALDYAIYLGFASFLIDGLAALGIVIRLLEDERRSAPREAEARSRRERELDRQRQELRISEEKFAALFRASPDAVTITLPDKGGVIIAVNRGFERITGYSAKEAVGNTTVGLGLFVRPEDRLDMLERAVRAGGRLGGVEFPVRRKDGEVIIVEMSAELAELQGERYAISVSRDVTESRRAREALRQSEEKFSKVFRTSPDAIAISRIRDGVLVEVNESFERLSGRSAAEALGKTTVELGLWIDPEARTEMRRRLLEQGRLRDVELPFQNRTGERGIGSVSAEIMEFGGEPCMVIVARNVTQSRRAEQALRQSEEKFAKVFRSSPDAISISTLADGRYLDVNEGYERLFGHSRQQAIGRSAIDLGIWVDLEQRARLIRAVKERERVSDFEAELRTAAGERRRCSLSVELIELAGEPCMVSVVRDVTERRLGEQRLRDSEERLRLAVDAAQLGTWEWHVGTGDVKYSARVEPILGLPQGGFAGTFEALLAQTHPEDRPALERLMAEVMAGTRDEFDIEQRVFARDGAQRWIEGKGRVYRDEAGKPLCLRGAVIDISERKRAEQALRDGEDRLRRREQLAAMGTLVAGVAHEVRTPLFGISATLDAYEGQLAGAQEQEEFFGLVRSQVKRLSNVMGELLEYAKPSGLQLETGSIQAIARKAVLSCGALARRAEVTIVEDLPDALPDVKRDACRLEQVFQNLVANAVQHAPRGTSVCIRASALESGSRRGVACAVEDEGPGIPAEDLGHVFQPLFSRRKGGTGLGLSIVQRIVEEHGGAVAAANRRGGGAVFTVFLPAADSARPAGQSGA